MRKTIYITLLSVNILFAALLLLSYLSTFIPPAKIWQFAFFGLFYPYFLAVNIIFFIIWLLSLRRAIFISVIVILAGWNHLTDYFPFHNLFSGNRMEQAIEDKTKLRIISYNIRAFNMQEWIDDLEVKNNILNLILSEKPDIICLQEYYAENIDKQFSDRLKSVLKETPYHHINYSIISETRTGYGMAIFSRYPVVGKGSFHFLNSANMAIFTDIAMNSDTFRIYNNHLQSINLIQRNYDFVDSLRLRYDEKQLEELKDITRRLKHAFIKRSVQVDSLSSHIKKSRYPVIVCGDFNDTPVSYTYRKMRAGLKDSFVSFGGGTGNTYLGVFPAFRIDYIFHSPQFRTFYFERIEAVLSDHYPIICDLQYGKGMR